MRGDAARDSTSNMPSEAHSATDNSTVDFNGQTSHGTYKSTEVWLKEKSGWRMISSQTLTVPSDPPAAKLASNVLDEYVGTYKASDA